MHPVVVETATGPFAQTVTIGPHALIADEPADRGGTDQGPEPHAWVLAGLGACTSMTLASYARLKGFALARVRVRLTGERAEDGYRIARIIELEGELTEEQRQRLLEIAGRCPVHRTLTGAVHITSTLAP